MKRVFGIGVLIFCSVALAFPAGAEVKLGGIIFTDVYYLDRDKDNALFCGVGEGTSSHTVTAVQLPDISRFYARWTNEDNVACISNLAWDRPPGILRIARTMAWRGSG